MRRREFVTFVVGATATRPLAARAQQPAAPIIGFLNPASPTEFAYRVAAFRNGLAEMGYAEDQNVKIEYRWGQHQYDRLPELATDEHRLSKPRGKSAVRRSWIGVIQTREPSDRLTKVNACEKFTAMMWFDQRYFSQMSTVDSTPTLTRFALSHRSARARPMWCKCIRNSQSAFSLLLVPRPCITSSASIE
jgi:hypothetical protein